MSRYFLRAKYDIEDIIWEIKDNAIIVDIPMLSDGKLKYGLEHIKEKLNENDVYPSRNRI